VDERIALAGFSGGGYVAPRVAIHDDRVTALIANDPMVDYARVAEALLGPLVKKVAGFLLKWALPRKVGRKPLIRAGEGEEMLRQTREFHEAIASREKAMHVFSLERDGTHDHCMLDNHSRMQQVLFEWLGGVFGRGDRGADADAHSRRASRTRNASSKNSIARSV